MERQQLVVPVMVGREGSKRLVVAAAKMMAVQRKRWIRTGAAEEMDQDGSDVGGLSDRRNHWKRRQSGKGQPGPQGTAGNADCLPVSHRRGRRRLVG